MNKKTMVIGGGRGQIPIMNLCHKYGYDVLAVSPKGNYPGLNIADDVLYADVRDYDKILATAKEKDVRGVLTDQLDVGVYTAALVSEKLHLNGISTNVASRFTNKFIMRKAAEEAGINVPHNQLLKSLDDLDKVIEYLQFPLIMKPVDSDASRGVYKVNNRDEIRSHYPITKSYSKADEIILEEFITGKEYVVEAYTSNYVVNNLVVGHRDYFEIDGAFIPCATVFSDAHSADSLLEERIKEINSKLVSSFGLPFGITHAEYLHDEKTDEIYLVEIAARGGGVFISSDLIPLACGVDANDLYVRNALGLPCDNKIEISTGASAYFCYLTPEGTVSRINNTDQIMSITGVHKAFFDNIEIGMKTASIKDKSSRKGPILVKGKSKKDCYDTISKVKKILDIKVITNNGEEDIRWN